MLVIVNDGDRNTLLTVKKGAVEKDVRAAFLKIAALDPVWKTWVKTHHPTFQIHRERFNISSTLAPTEKLQEGQIIRLSFSPLVPVDTSHASQQQTSEQLHSAIEPSRPNSAALVGNPDLQRDWL